MLAESLDDRDAVELTDRLANSDAVAAHRALVAAHTDREPRTPVVALAPGPWLSAAADAPLAGSEVKGNCWRGYALFIPSATARRVTEDEGRLDGELLHEMVEDVQSDRDEHPYREARRDYFADYLLEGATEAVTQELLAGTGSDAAILNGDRLGDDGAFPGLWAA